MILVMGGYGGFGARIARRLALAGETVLVAGRSFDKAQSFCVGTINLMPLRLDRERDLASALAAYRPFAVVNATGPFQASTLAVPEACIVAGCHYIDIADGRAFVAGIAALDAAAKAAKVCVIAGASSVPALSGAVIRTLAADFDIVTAVEMALSASNKATAGNAVTRSILSYVGKPMRLWRGQRWAVVHGWQEPRRQGFVVDGKPPMAPRLVALADVPDLELVPDRLPGRPTVAFRAGTELAVENVGLWVLSWVVRLRLLSRLEAIAPAVIAAKTLTMAFGTDRSAMIVRLFGRSAGQRLERRWTLIASNGDGPEIPALAVPLFVAKLRRGALAPGARDGGQDLVLADFTSAFGGLSIAQASEWVDQQAPLYVRVMGDRFAMLPPRVRALHDVLRDSGWQGAGRVRRDRSLLARLVTTFMRFPPDGEHALHVAFAEREGVETWTRDFSGWRFRSEMSKRGPYLVERFGPLWFAFDLASFGPRDAGHRKAGLSMRLMRWGIGPIPMPRALAPAIAAHEWEDEDRFQFEVSVGSIIHYRGWLSPVSS